MTRAEIRQPDSTKSLKLFPLSQPSIPLPSYNNVVVLSDSGKLVIFEVDFDKKKFVRINQEIYGKSGCRRIT
ncbi:hypothetical protein J6X04_00500, partial [Candidatus Saccharibacteria bacterium]|nr:hypothetical protein [Candidatus Saccharibacteria bacterium]